MKRAFFSWSGGKDSMLALHRALESGYQVEALLVMFDESGERSRSHGLPPRLLRAQAEALGIPLIVRQASWATYEAEFIAATTALAAQGVRYGLFGDIDLEPHRVWEEKVCGAAGVEAVLPLWQEPRPRLVDEFLALAYRARVVCTNARWLDGSFAGATSTPRFCVICRRVSMPAAKMANFTRSCSTARASSTRFSTRSSPCTSAASRGPRRRCFTSPSSAEPGL